MLVAALVTAGAVVALPEAASAAPAFSKTLLYATTSDGSGVVSIDRSTGATSTVVAAPSGSGSINQLGLSADGTTLVLTDPNTLYEWNTSTGKYRTTTRTAGVTNNMGGIDPKSGRYWYGGVVTNSTTAFTFTSYDPVTHTNSGKVVSVTAEGSAGTNGDLAFDGQGNMYFVKSSSSSAQIYRVDAADLNRPGTATVTAVKVGPAITIGTALNSMAFGDDSYLYIAGSGTNAFLKVDPITGRVVGTQNLAAKVTDMASNALPTTGSVSATRPATTFDPGDQFTVTIGGNGVTTNNSATTTADDATATAGPVLLLPGQPDPYTISQDPAGTTNPRNYTTTWLCADPATGKTVMDGQGTTGTFTIPAGVAAVDCTFTNAVKPRPVATTDDAPVSEQGAPVTVDVVGNDSGDLQPATLRLTDTDGRHVETMHVPDQGDWTVDTTNGSVTFTPVAGFTGDPDPVDYTVTDSRGLVTGAQVVVTYRPTAADDTSAGNAQGVPTTMDVTANDSANVDPSSVRLLDVTGTRVSTLPVAGQGTWTVDPTSGDVTFTPAHGFTGNPAPVTYRVGNRGGDTVTATVTVGYGTAAVADDARDNALGSTVSVDVTTNDSANVDPSSVRVLDADGSPVTTLPIADQGTWSVDSGTGTVTFTPVAGYTGNPAPVTYTVDDGHGHASTASVQVAYRPAAAPDAVVAPTPGAAVTVDVLANDSAGLERNSVHLVDGDGNATRELVVDGTGTWTVDPDTGKVTFTPEDGFTGDPAPVEYTAGDAFERGVRQTVTVSYPPVAGADRSPGNTVGSPSSIAVTTNDSSNVVASSVRLVRGAALVTELAVPGQGTWSVDTTTGTVTFTPAPGFTGDPTPVRYSVQDAAGHTATAAVTIGYAPVAAKDVSRRNAPGTAVTVGVIGNDSTNVDRATLRLVGADGQPVTARTVRGEGTWTVDPTVGTVTFAPEARFTGNPTTARYTVQDTTGDSAAADVDVTYLPAAADDASLGNTIGEAVTVDVTANDSRNVAANSVRLLAARRAAVTSMAVDGQGTWTVDTATGRITFTPLAGAVGDPSPVAYSVSDASGDTVSATLRVTYAKVVVPADPAAPAPTPATPVTPATPTAPAALATHPVDPRPAARPTPAAAPGGKLAFTGAELLWPGVGALALVLAGGVLLLTRRRRDGRHL